MRLAADIVMRCGRIIVIGEEPQFPAIDTTEIAQKELEIVGSRNGSYQEMTEAIRLLENGTVKPHVAAHYPLEEINDGFRLPSRRFVRSRCRSYQGVIYGQTRLSQSHAIPRCRTRGILTTRKEWKLLLRNMFEVSTPERRFAICMGLTHSDAKLRDDNTKLSDLDLEVGND